ncbi:hypothetical protein PAHAL_7G270400 [Panicum hallii]|uniref:F-box domain-containing protein n=2 Tax=Panicum hallii TaxID=206008 RepID=A0A2T8IDL5_9POAL|nr:hypothetical protein PAHAL_7G270400 [Panicum hallii]
MTMAMATTSPTRGDLFLGPHADRYIVEWITGLNLLWRKQLRRREAMRPQGPASNEALANVFQRLPPRSVAACRAVCLRWSVLLSSPRLASLAHVDDDDAAGSSTCFFAGRDDGVRAGQGRRQRRRAADTTPAAATSFPPLPKHQYRRTKKQQGYRRMF